MYVQTTPAERPLTTHAVESPPFLARLKALDPEAIDAVYRLYGTQVLRYAFRQTGDWSQAEDVTSEVFIRLLESLETYQARGVPLLAWLYRVARNLIIDQRRRSARRPVVIFDEALDHPTEQAEFSAEGFDLDVAMAGLSPEQRDVVTLRFQEGLSAEEVAAVLGRSVPAVRSLQHRALDALRRKLGGRHG